MADLEKKPRKMYSQVANQRLIESMCLSDGGLLFFEVAPLCVSMDKRTGLEDARLIESTLGEVFAPQTLLHHVHRL